MRVLKARKIGIKACIEKLGYKFCCKYAGNSTTAYSDDGDAVFCYVGVDTENNTYANIEEWNPILTEKNLFPYYAMCEVNRRTGEVVFLKCALPEKEMGSDNNCILANAKSAQEMFDSMRDDAQRKGIITEENADKFICEIREERRAKSKKEMNEYLKKYPPYKKREPLNFDLRGYTAYLEEHGIDGKNVPEEVVEKFRIKPTEKNADE